MPIGYTTDPDHRVVFVKAWGVLAERDLVAVAAALRSDPRVSPGWATLTDTRDVEDIRLGGSFIHGYSSALAPTARREVLVSSDLAIGIARMYSLSQGFEENFHVCRSAGEALEWLGLPAGTVLPARVDELGSEPEVSATGDR